MFGGPLLNDGMVLSRRDYTYTEPTIVSGRGRPVLMGGRRARTPGWRPRLLPGACSWQPTQANLPVDVLSR